MCPLIFVAPAWLTDSSHAMLLQTHNVCATTQGVPLNPQSHRLISLGPAQRHLGGVPAEAASALKCVRTPPANLGTEIATDSGRVAKETAQEAAEEAAKEAYDEAYKETYDEVYRDSYDEAYREALAEALDA